MSLLSTLESAGASVSYDPTEGEHWARGTIVLAKTEWFDTITEIVPAFNDHQDRMYEMAMKVYASVLESKKYGENWNQAFWRDPTITGLRTCLSGTIHRALFYRYTSRMYKPRMLDFAHSPYKGPLLCYTAGSELEVDTDNRVLRWTSRDGASELPVVAEMFEVLSRLEYPRRTGGILITPSGTASFGPLGGLLLGGVCHGRDGKLAAPRKGDRQKAKGNAHPRFRQPGDKR